MLRLLGAFDGQLSHVDTLIEFGTGYRTVSGSSDLYHQMLNNNLDDPDILDKISCFSFVVGNFTTMEHLKGVYSFALEKKKDMELCFQYRSKNGRGEEIVGTHIYDNILVLLEDWCEDGFPIMLEPFNDLISKIKGQDTTCLFSDRCMKNNLFIDVDGSIHHCWLGCDRGHEQSLVAAMHDNTHRNAVMEKIKDALSVNSFHQECLSCEFFEICRGGCKFDNRRDRLDKSRHCYLWKKAIPILLEYV